MGIKYCEDCKHFMDNDSIDRCLHPNALRTGYLLVKKDIKPFADEERLSTGNCGPEGKHWEANNVPR